MLPYVQLLCCCMLMPSFCLYVVVTKLAVMKLVWPLQMPFGLLEVVLYSCIVYFIVGYERGAGYFFIFYLICFSMMQVMSAIMRFNACASPNMVISNACGTCSASGDCSHHAAWPHAVLVLYCAVLCRAMLCYLAPMH